MTTAPVNIVFGETGGIGSALCRLLDARGVRPVVAARSDVSLRALADSLPDITAVKADATIPDDVRRVFDLATEKFGGVDGAAHCVGWLLLKPAHLTTALTANPASLAASTAMHALGRIGEADDDASAIAWLLDSGNTFVTGQVIAVDGGLGSLQPRFVQPTPSRS